MAAELLVRKFLAEITPKLFPDDSFMSKSLNDSAFVNGNSVELPHSGTIPSVAVNRSSLPGTIAKRTDAATQYLLEELTSDPTLLQDSEALIVAYGKRASILKQHVDKINAKAANRVLYNWAATGASNVVTTGTARATSSPSATGTRKAVTKANIISAIALLNQQEVPLGGRSILLPADMYQDILGIDEFTRADAFGKSNIPDGVIGSIFGLTVYMRSSSVVMTGVTIKAEGAAGAAADNQAAVLWHSDFVRTAVGAKKVFIDSDNPAYYGSIFSAMARHGSLRARNDNKGVVTISEAVGA